MKGKTFCALVAMMLATTAMAQDGPTMGWSSWNTYGVNINENLIKSQADAMVNTGLKDVGFDHINIDDGYFGGRDSSGKLLIHPQRFPNGLRGIVDYIHSKGLKAGIYSDAGRNTCGSMFNGDAIGKGVGMYGHDQQDADLFFKDLNFDFIKVDFCGGSWYHNEDHLVLDEQERYTAIAQAIRNTGRTDVRMNACRWAYPGTWVEGQAFSWRTTGDIYDGWESVKGIVAENLYLSAYSSKGHYNDMDMLEVGRSMNDEEDKTHFGLWCIMNSPLLIGCNLTNIRSSTLSLLKNQELIALNQDPLYQQAYVLGYTNGCHILVKDVEVLNGNKRAFAVYNPNDDARQVSVSFKDLDLAGTVRLRDVFARNNVGDFTNNYSVYVPAHGTRIFTAEAQTRLERTRYEAETAYISVYQEIKSNQSERTGVYSANNSCSGGYKAEWLGSRPENALEWRNVYSQTGGEYDMTIGFISGENRNITISVNGQDVQTINVNSGGWGTVGTATVAIQLDKGKNTVKLSNASDWMPDIDYMELTLTKPFEEGSAEVTEPYQVGDDLVQYAPTEWAGQTNGYGGLGHQAYEHYNSGSVGAGEVLTQKLTGLQNGVYTVTLEVAASFTPDRGFECPTGNGLSVAFANGTQKNLEVIGRTWVSSVTPITIYASVTDGTLKYGIYNLQTSGNWYVANVTSIKYISENATLSHELTVSSAGLATLYLPFDAAIPDADFFVVVAVKEIAGSTAHLKEVHDVIPANTGVMIYANEGTYSLPLATTASTENVESLLHGVLEDTPVTTLVAQEGKSIYVLSRGVKEYVGFKRLSGNGSVTYIPANRAYLPFSTSSQVNFINVSFGDSPTGIDTLRISNQEDSHEIYDLTGRKVTAPQKGIYIVNGKKVLYKP